MPASVGYVVLEGMHWSHAEYHGEHDRLKMGCGPSTHKEDVFQVPLDPKAHPPTVTCSRGRPPRDCNASASR